MAHSPDELAAFRARCRLGLTVAMTTETPQERYIRRRRMVADYREAGQADQPGPEPKTLADRPAEPVELSALLNQQEHIRAELAYLRNKLMGKRAEKKKSSRYETYTD